ncbi:hypothetical protein QKW45_11575 [Streptomyces sp. AJ-1]|uniref:hypothetical protein n=1 Tax=Streptomyces sp. AJ-1 TaxID=3044384 RepID=UPI00249B96FD|nr:hypothetical protein [Streptomyces sp. AJ-1]MDI3344364.1 hypothetical protein [Streptomyces sp. AJ-1]
MDAQLPRSEVLCGAARKAAPAIATSTVLILARLWNANGAEHSTGSAVLMGALAAGCALAGMVTSSGLHGDRTTSAIAFTGAGAFALAGVAGYADGLSLPLLLWGIATVLAYAVAHRHWRADRRAETAHRQRMEVRQADDRHAETVEVIRARAQIEALAHAVALSDAHAYRQGLPGFTPGPLALEQPARAELPAGDGGA